MIKRFLGEKIGKAICWISAILTITVCLSIIAFIFLKGYKDLSFQFLASEPISSIHHKEQSGISSPLFGTILLTLIGIVIALPWALGCAIYLTEYAKKGPLITFFRVTIDVLSGVPTIVIAILGLAIFSNPSMGFLSSMVEGVAGIKKAFGRSFLVSGITMAIMILPFVIKTCEEALKTVPQTYKEASLAIGASKWHTIIKIVIPSSIKGISTAIILGMGRIIGDTAIVWLTLGGTLRMTGVQPWYLPQNLISTLKNTGSTLTSYIYFMSPAGEGNMVDKAFAASLVLILFILILNFLTDIISGINKNISEER